MQGRLNVRKSDYTVRAELLSTLNVNILYFFYVSCRQRERCMAVMTKKRIVMTLYSGSKDIESHRVRIVLAEKGILSDVIEIGRHNIVEDLSRLNPYNFVPTLVDCDLVLYNSNIIVEYLDERFPHPPLLPVYPVMRAKYRLMMYRIERDWCSLIMDI